ncbi:MAG: TIGR00725 family protein [Desulfobacterales bacterium]
MKKTFIIGVMGGGKALPAHEKAAYNLGKLIAQRGWILLNGGRNSGIMEASAKGAFENGGLTVGILPDNSDARVSDYISVPIITGLGSARNWINVLSSHVVVACPGGAGTLSEIALALKSGKKVVLLDFDPGTGFDNYRRKKDLIFAETPQEAIKNIKIILKLLKNQDKTGGKII